MFKILLYIAIALILVSCRDSTSIDTPRKYEEIISNNNTEIEFEIRLNGTLQDMMLEKNNKEYLVFESSPRFVKCRVEFQNKSQSNIFMVKSIYFRSQYLPVDGKIYSLSGDPDNSSNFSASKIVFNIPLKGEIPIIPDTTKGLEDNFMISFSPTDNIKKIVGTLYYKTNNQLLPGSAEITGDFIIKIP